LGVKLISKFSILLGGMPRKTLNECSELFSDILNRYKHFKNEYNGGKSHDALLTFKGLFVDLEFLVAKDFFLNLEKLFCLDEKICNFPDDVDLDFYSDARKTLSNSVNKLQWWVKTGTRENNINKYKKPINFYLQGIFYSLSVVGEVFQTYKNRKNGPDKQKNLSLGIR